MKFAVTRLDLGKTRQGVGYVLYNDESKAFEELTPSEVKELIKKDEVAGLKLLNGDIRIDDSYCKNMMRKSGVGNFSPIGTYRSSNLSSILSVVGKNETEFGFMYEVISNFCQRVIMDEDTLLSYNKTGVVNGISLDENNAVVLHPKVGEYLICKPESFKKDDLFFAKIDLNTEEGSAIAEEKRKVNGTTSISSIEELFESLEIEAEKHETIDGSVHNCSTADCTNICNDVGSDEHKSASAHNTGNTSRPKSKRNSKSA